MTTATIPTSRPSGDAPFLLTQRRTEYEVVPDARRRQAMQVFSVDEVVGITPGSPEPLRIEPVAHALPEQERVQRVQARSPELPCRQAVDKHVLRA